MTTSLRTRPQPRRGDFYRVKNLPPARCRARQSITLTADPTPAVAWRGGSRRHAESPPCRAPDAGDGAESVAGSRAADQLNTIPGRRRRHCVAAGRRAASRMAPGAAPTTQWSNRRSTSFRAAGTMHRRSRKHCAPRPSRRRCCLGPWATAGEHPGAAQGGSSWRRAAGGCRLSSLPSGRARTSFCRLVLGLGRACCRRPAPCRPTRGLFAARSDAVKRRSCAIARSPPMALPPARSSPGCGRTTAPIGAQRRQPRRGGGAGGALSR